MRAVLFFTVIIFSNYLFADGKFNVPVLDRVVAEIGNRTIHGKTPRGVYCTLNVSADFYANEGARYNFETKADERGPWSRENMASGTLWYGEDNIKITDREISWGHPSAEDSIVMLKFNNRQKLVRIEAKDYGYGGGPIDDVVCNISNY